VPAPYHSVFTGRIPFLSPNQQSQSTEGKEKITGADAPTVWLKVTPIRTIGASTSIIPTIFMLDALPPDVSQPRINWEGCGRKGIQHKMVRIMEVGALIVQIG